ncbi:MAG: hypothetical protein ING73_00780, partial [Rhodocyclaceae bacterium]|nr:hypothetical protein [Rhodocyclaceae bacterium]
MTAAFKGFDHKWQCRGFQYAVGESYEHEGAVQACSSGFHACEMPLNVFDYYPPADYGLLNSFALVECSGEIHRDGSHSKIASAKIQIKAELSLPQLVGHMVSWVMSHIDATIPQTATNTGDQSAATNTGNRSAATNTGNRSAATNTGDQSAATNTGDQSAATNTGNRSAATNTGYQSAATNTGDQSAATNTGYQ